MAKYLDAKCKKCRRFGVKMCSKGERGSGAKCALTRRNYPPGIHGPKGLKRLTDYGVHLQEKQKVKVIYYILERQLSNYFKKAVKSPDTTGQKLIELLERRLDNVVYKLGLASSRSQARQFVGHSLFLVNGKKNNIPSYQVKEGDILSLRKEKTKDKGKLSDNLKLIEKYEQPEWLSWDVKECQGKVINLPRGKSLDVGIDTRLVVEFYSK